MTTHKSFKRLVRARMAKTGERYATARRAIVGEVGSGPAAPGNATAGVRRVHPESAALTRVLADCGVTSALDGGPLSEALVLVIGGGLGAGYILWEFKARAWAILVLGFRNRWQYPAIPGWTGNVLDRLAIPADVHETGGAVGARATLDGLLGDRTSVLAWVDQQTMGTWGYPAELSGYRGYPVVVAGRTPGGDYLVDDRGDEPLAVDGATLAAARARIVSYKHRLIVPRPATATLTAERLRSVTLATSGGQLMRTGT